MVQRKMGRHWGTEEEWKFQPCGRKSASGSKESTQNYVPLAKTRMTKSERASAVSRKRSKAQGVGGKPTMSTFTKKYYGGMIEI